ncbi:MAG: cyclase family protein [Desulfuromonadales bacterium]|nr:cyclase family protein [Desulfuromonadales bacterium]
MKKIIDISLPLIEELPVWPGSPKFELVQVSRLGFDGCNETRLSLGSHTGTHIDAPRHFVENGATVDQLSLEVLVGEAYVVECTATREISAEILERLTLPSKVERLLFKTGNSDLWSLGQKAFFEDFAALTLDGAEWLVQKGVTLVGIDYLSIQRFHDSNATHEVLLGAGVVVLEGLNLAGVTQGLYDLTCLPLYVVGAEGAPARAILSY